MDSGGSQRLVVPKSATMTLMSPPPPLSIAVARFKRLPQRSNETWQGGLVTLPMWVANPDDPDGPPYRPSGAIWVSLSSGLLHLALPEDGRSASADLALRALLEFGSKHAKSLTGRPSVLQVRDQEIAQALSESMAGLDTRLVVVDELPAVREAMFALEESSPGGRLPGALEGAAVTVEQLRSFAEAAADFYRAAPWRQLSNDDLLLAESEAVPRGMRHFVVLGAGGQQFGLAFFESRQAFERTIEGDGDPPRRSCGVTFGAIDELPFADVDAWEALQLSSAGPDAFPLAVEFSDDGGVRRFDANELSAAEVLLRTIAETTEDDLDTGAWSKTASLNGTALTVGLTLPLLLEAEAGTPARKRLSLMRYMSEKSGVQIGRFLEGRSLASLDEVNAEIARAQEAGLFDQPAEAVAGRPLTDLERAQDLAYEAMESLGRVRVKRARQALAISVDCADAYIVLGEAANTAREALEWYERAVAAGERAVGADSLATLAGECWGRLETRPYMRARLAFAQTLWDVGEGDRALDHYRELLRLNPNDNQGVRYLLLPALLKIGRDDEADALLREYREDPQAVWLYARALRAFRAEGDSAGARTALEAALRANPHVIRCWLNADAEPRFTADHFALGSPEEGQYVADVLQDLLDVTPGALEWIDDNADLRRRPVGRKPVKGRQRRKR